MAFQTILPFSKRASVVFTIRPVLELKVISGATTTTCGWSALPAAQRRDAFVSLDPLTNGVPALPSTAAQVPAQLTEEAVHTVFSITFALHRDGTDDGPVNAESSPTSIANAAVSVLL